MRQGLGTTLPRSSTAERAVVQGLGFTGLGFRVAMQGLGGSADTKLQCCIPKQSNHD